MCDAKDCKKKNGSSFPHATLSALDRNQEVVSRRLDKGTKERWVVRGGECGSEVVSGGWCAVGGECGRLGDEWYAVGGRRWPVCIGHRDIASLPVILNVQSP